MGEEVQEVFAFWVWGDRGCGVRGELWEGDFERVGQEVWRRLGLGWLWRELR